MRGHITILVLVLLAVPTASASCVDDALLLDISTSLNFSVNQTIRLLDVFNDLCDRTDTQCFYDEINIQNRLFRENVTLIRNQTSTQINDIRDEITRFDANMSGYVDEAMTNYTGWFEAKTDYAAMMTSVLAVFNASTNIETFEGKVDDKIMAATSDLNKDNKNFEGYLMF